MQQWLDNNDILMYSTHNEGKSVKTKRFIKTLRSKIYKKWQFMIANLMLFEKISRSIQLVDLIIIVLIKNLLMLIILLRLNAMSQILKLLNLK